MHEPRCDEMTCERYISKQRRSAVSHMIMVPHGALSGRLPAMPGVTPNGTQCLFTLTPFLGGIFQQYHLSLGTNKWPRSVPWSSSMLDDNTYSVKQWHYPLSVVQQIGCPAWANLPCLAPSCATTRHCITPHVLAQLYVKQAAIELRATSTSM